MDGQIPVPVNLSCMQCFNGEPLPRGMLKDEDIPEDCLVRHPLFGEQCRMWSPHRGLHAADHMTKDQTWIELKWDTN